MTQIKPALMPEEWENAYDENGCVLLAFRNGLTGVIDPEDFQRDAAAMLANQPFGFNWGDVDFLRTIGEHFRRTGPEMCGPDSIADRIEALLPPRKS